MQGLVRLVRFPLGVDGAGLAVRMLVPAAIADLLEASPRVVIPANQRESTDLALGGPQELSREVSFSLPEGGRVVEATVVRCDDGLTINYLDPYMRKPDPDSLLVASSGPSDEPDFADQFGVEFRVVKPVIHEFLAQQELVAVPFYTGGNPARPALAIMPNAAAFFAVTLLEQQGGIEPAIFQRGEFEPRAILFVAPLFRHTHCAGRQIVVHDRTEDCHEVYALHLHPGSLAIDRISQVPITVSWALRPHSRTRRSGGPASRCSCSLHRQQLAASK